MLDKLKNLSTGEKLFAFAALTIGGYLLYSYYTDSDASASEGDVAKPLPAGAPAPVAPVVIPTFSGPTRSGGASAYVVATQSDPLNIRSGPSTGYAVIGMFDKGSTVKATGRLADGSGMTWAEVLTPSGQKAWSSTTYLKAV